MLEFTFNQETFIDFLLCKSYCVRHHMNQCELDTKNNAGKKYYRMASGLISWTDSQVYFFLDHLNVSTKLSTCNSQASN